MSNENLEDPGKICLYWVLRISIQQYNETKQLVNIVCSVIFLLLSSALVRGALCLTQIYMDTQELCLALLGAYKQFLYKS